MREKATGYGMLTLDVLDCSFIKASWVQVVISPPGSLLESSFDLQDLEDFLWDSMDGVGFNIHINLYIYHSRAC